MLVAGVVIRASGFVLPDHPLHVCQTLGGSCMDAKHGRFMAVTLCLHPICAAAGMHASDVSPPH